MIITSTDVYVYVLCPRLSLTSDIHVYILYTYVHAYMYTFICSPCNITVCDTDFFMSGGSCLACPAGSSRQTDDDPGSCGCDGGMVTGDGSTSTSDMSTL